MQKGNNRCPFLVKGVDLGKVIFPTAKERIEASLSSKLLTLDSESLKLIKIKLEQKH
tara:strand:+ start:62 stop:232 length:171 start_codon:yes stop_codon:yes gene_type:complete